jgi:DNA-binding MarR family transcriptional regulator
MIRDDNHHLLVPSQPEVLVETVGDKTFGASAVTPALAGYTGYLLRRATTGARQVMQGAMPPRTHPRDYAILGVLAESSAVSQQELADRLGINRTEMVKFIDRLEQEGHVQRSRNPADRRSYALTLTPAGRRARDRMKPAVARGEASLTASLDPAERSRLNELLRLLLPRLDSGLPQPPNQRTGYLLIHADMQLRRRGEQQLALAGTQTRHFSALAALDQIGPCTQQELANELGVNEVTMVSVVDDLATQGFVERQRDPRDRRRYALRLTGDGRSLLARSRAAMDVVNAEVAELLGEDGEQELRTLLAKLIKT